jgi:iron-sulfur cluster repair protein YtfE (RIC family)
MSLLSTIKKTGRNLEDAIIGKPKGAAKDDMDILDKLKQEHEEAAELLETICDEDSNGSERKAALKKLKGALIPHLRAEGKVVYDPIIALKDKKVKQDGLEGHLEHEIAERTLLQLTKIQNAMSPEFSATAKVLKELIEHHVEEEEDNVWSDVRKNFSSDDRLQMNRDFEAAKKKVKMPA